MAKIYETGNKNYVIRMACRHAIDDRESMIDGYTSNIPDSRLTLNAQDLEYVNKCKAEVRDFKKLLQRTFP